MQYNRSTDRQGQYIVLKKALIIFISLLFSLASLYLFYRQYQGQYTSDLLDHIAISKEAKSLYSPMYSLLGFIDQLPYAKVLIPTFLTLFIILSVWATKVLLAFSLPKRTSFLLWIYAWICNMVFPLYFRFLPFFHGELRYRGLLNSNIYHNSTYIASKPFAILSVIFFFVIISKWQKRISPKDLIGFSLVLSVATAFKPNFTIGFSFVVLFWICYSFIKSHFKGFWSFFALGASVLPSVFLIIYQQAQVFDKESHVSFGFLVGYTAGTGYHPIIIFFLMVVSLAFPIAIFVAVLREKAIDKFYILIMLNLVVNVLISLFLYEEGPRISHGNLFWGTDLAVGLAFIVSISKLDELFLQRRYRKTIILSGILSVHCYCWICYFFDILNGGIPY